MAGAVLTLTDSNDATAERVHAELAVRGVQVVRIDPADFPMGLDLAATCDRDGWAGTLTGTTGDGRAIRLDLADVQAVYYRRPTQFQLEAGMSDPEKLFAYGEARRGFGGVLLALEHCLWLNDPVAAAAAEYKPRQLAAAARAGLRIPRSIITNDPARARAFAEDLARPVVYKPLSGAWIAESDNVNLIYTSVITDAADLDDPAICLTANLFQEQIAKDFEARAVVVGDEVFCVAIRSHSEAGRIDWRCDYGSLTYEVIVPPEQVRAGLLAMHRDLGLHFGAADLAITPDGDWVLFETNQNGEWFWLAEHGQLPIASALADLLQTGATCP